MLWETILLALREIRRNVLRSFLTVLGIVIGVGAVIIMVTVGNGVTAKVTSDISELGTNMLLLRAGQHRRGGSSEASAKFKAADVTAVQRDVPGILALAPSVGASTQAVYGNENWSTTILGSTNAYLTVRNWVIKNGRNFTANEVRGGKAVCIIGQTVREKLFGEGDPIGQNIRLKTVSCKVIAELIPKGVSGFGSDQDDFILMPLRAVQRRFKGNTDIDTIYISATDQNRINQVEQDVTKLMRERRRVADGKPDDFHVRNTKELMTALTGTTQVLTALLSAVAAVSLLVGGIGIMNIMLVSVTERTREIGTRLAIGAMEREVLMQFLVEAVVLSSFGGLVGIGGGLAAAYGVAGLLNVPFVLDPGIVLIAFAFSGAVGVLFGYFPARKAAQLDPIEALRHE